MGLGLVPLKYPIVTPTRLSCEENALMCWLNYYLANVIGIALCR